VPPYRGIPDDVPFAFLYLVDEDARRPARNRPADFLLRCSPALRSPLISQREPTLILWPIAQVVNSGQSLVVDVGNISGSTSGPAQQAISAADGPVSSSRGDDRPLGILVAGVNPTRRLDAEYRTFYDLIASQIATAIQNVRAAEEERKRLEALAEIDRAKTAFFSNVSHEFRTPLTLMLGRWKIYWQKLHRPVSFKPRANSKRSIVNGTRLLAW